MAGGAAFDATYMRQMVDDHQKDVALFEKQASGGRDADLKAFAGKTLPTLKQHLQHAEKTHAAVDGAKGAAKK